MKTKLLRKMRKDLSIKRFEERYFGTRYQAFMFDDDLSNVKHTSMREPLQLVHRIIKDRLRLYTIKITKVWP